MNKAELIKEVEKVTCTKKEAVGAVNAVFAAISKALKKGGDRGHSRVWDIQGGQAGSPHGTQPPDG